MTLRPYEAADSKVICSWVKDEKQLFQWSADRIGKWPLGRKMLELAIQYAKERLQASHITLGVFSNNPKARACYESVGFKEYSTRTVNILGSDWECVDMELFMHSHQEVL